MSDKLDRVRALIARALDAGSSEEERRTSAVIAVRLIHEHGLLGRGGSAPGPTRIEYRDRIVYQDRIVYRDRDPSPVDFPPMKKRVVIESKFNGRCQVCGERYQVGQTIAWSRTEGPACMRCHRGEPKQAPPPPPPDPEPAYYKPPPRRRRVRTQPEAQQTTDGNARPYEPPPADQTVNDFWEGFWDTGNGTDD